jgi:hypothetical protein
MNPSEAWNAFMDASHALMDVIPMQPHDSTCNDDQNLKLIPQDRVLRFSHDYGQGAWFVREHFGLEGPEGNTALASTSSNALPPARPIFAMIMHLVWIFGSREDAEGAMCAHPSQFLELASETGSGMMKEASLESICDHMCHNPSATEGDEMLRALKAQMKALANEMSNKADKVASSRMKSIPTDMNLKINGFCVVAQIDNVIFKYYVSSFSQQMNDMVAILALEAASNHISRIHALRQATAWPSSISTQMEMTRPKEAIEMQMSAVAPRGFSCPRSNSVHAGSLTSLDTQDRLNEAKSKLLHRFKCAGCGMVPEGLKVHKICSRCKKAYYCTLSCQRSDWNSRHKAICEPPAPVSENKPQ